MGAQGSPGRRPEAHHRLLPQGHLNVVLTVVLPCRNEAGNIARYRTDLFPALDALGVAYETVIVDDGSTDATAAAAAALEDLDHVRVVTLSSNRGMGGAIKAGIAEARGEWIATLDADLTFPPSALKEMLAAGIETKADLVSGSPYLRKGDMAGVSWMRALPSLMINALYRGLFGMRLTAYTPVLRLYRASFVKTLEIFADGFEINAEIASRAMIDRRVTAEVPAPLYARTAGVSKLQRGRELKRHLSLILRLLAGK